MRRRPVLTLRRGALPMLALLVSACSGSATSDPEVAPPLPPGQGVAVDTGVLPGFPLRVAGSEDATGQKVLLIHGRVTQDEVRFDSLVLEYGAARSYDGLPNQFRARLLDRSGRTLHEVGTWDPRSIATWEVDTAGSVRESWRRRSAAPFVLVLPYRQDAVAVQVLHPGARQPRRAPIAPALADLCRAYPHDPDCPRQ